MKTRRKSYQDVADEENPSSQMAEGREESISSDFDLDYLAQNFPHIEDWTRPSATTISQVYTALVEALKERGVAHEGTDRLQAELEKKEVELDQALQDRENETKELEASLESAKNELSAALKERDQLSTSQASLRAEVTRLASQNTTSSAELDGSKRQIEDVEREKRDLLGIISRVKQENAERDEEIQTLRHNLKDARHEHQSLEDKVRELQSSETTMTFKLETVTQQLQLSQGECERTTSELNLKVEEFSKYRRTKHAELSHLQASYDSLKQTHLVAENSLKALQSNHTALNHKLTQALTRVQDLTGQLAEQEATYASEMSGLRRLVSMMEDREKQAKEIVDNIERDLAEVGDRAERREAELRNNLERQRAATEEAEREIERLQIVLRKMEGGGLPSSHERALSAQPDSISDVMLGLSPTIAMVSKAQKSGKTFTEVYSEFAQLQQEYDQKCIEYEQMERTLASVLGQIQERAPILSQQREEYSRLQSEASQLASQLAQTISDRDRQANLARENLQKLNRTNRENELLQKQLQDLGRQVQVLLKKVARLENPALPPEEFFDGRLVKPAENVEEVITDNLVLFASTEELQEQNQKLLKVVRELGAKMEAEEREYHEQMEKEQGEAVREAHEAIQELVAELDRQKKTHETTVQAYIKERDALKGMLARAERGVATQMLVDGGDGDAEPRNDTSPVHETDLAKELAETQNQFAAYRSEMGVDSGRLHEELMDSQREVGKLGAALAKANAKIEFLNDRQRVIQEQLALQAHDNDNLIKRNQTLYDQYTRIDIEYNRCSEELSTANSRLEQLRNESANLRAEKKIWESAQARLVEENKSLSMERSHLADLMANVQRMHNDLERSGENDRRRLESQLQMLEGQTHDLKTQLSEERDTVRRLGLQKEIETKELQTRIDKMSEEFSKTRESLIEAETSKKHFEERLNELSRQLHGNEARLAVYDRRPDGFDSSLQSSDSGSNRLESELADVRSALQIAHADLATARRHVQQFKDISQANETALATLNETYDQDKASREKQIAQLESDRAAIEEKLRLEQTETSQLTDKYGQLQRHLETERAAWLSDKKILEDTIFDLGISGKHSENDRSTWEAEIRQLEERAKTADDRYSRELLAHAESIKSLDALKQQLGTAQATIRDLQAETETAKIKLATSENSWVQQKNALDKEISDLKSRCKDLVGQNNLLHQHLESVSSQAARIKQVAGSTSSIPGETESVEDTDTKLSELRAVVTYLRKEKEIVDLQLDLSKQENVRLKAQIEHVSHSLQETRAILSEERERAVETAISATQHADLVERINQLNILRESNATLRSDCEIYTKRAKELETKLQLLSAELDPAKEQTRIAQLELEARDNQIKRLEEENRRWQQRNSQLLSKYDRIDPEEFQALKDEIARLKAESISQKQVSVDQDEVSNAQTVRISALEDSIRGHKDMAAKNTAAFRSRLGQLNSEKSQMTATIADLRNQVKALTTEGAQPAVNLQTLKQQLEDLQREKEGLEKSLAEERASKTVHAQTEDQSPAFIGLREERDKLLEEKASWLKNSSATATDAGSVDEDRRVWEAEKAELMGAKDDALSRLQATIEEAKNLRFSNEKFQTRIQDLQKGRAADAERAIASQQAAVAAAIEKFKSEPDDASVPAPNERHLEELRALEDRLAAKHKQELEAAVAAARTEAQPTTTNVDHQAAISAAIANHEKEAQARHEHEIAQAVERGRIEQATRGKLKDQALIRTQAKLKELEAQVLEWRKAGLIPETSPKAAPAVSISTPGPSTTKTAPSTPATPVTASIPRKPSVTSVAPSADAEASQTTSASPATPTVVVRGRGIGRGRGMAIRGTATTSGGVSLGVPADASGGVSILGAATKRVRDEGASDDSLAKRLKPVESGTAGKPVTLRRDRVPPPP